MGLESLNGLQFGTLTGGIKTVPAGHQGRNSEIGAFTTPVDIKKIAAKNILTGQVASAGKTISTEEGIDVLNKKENQEILAYLNNSDLNTDANYDKSVFDGNTILKSDNNGELNPTYRKECGDYNNICLAA